MEILKTENKKLKSEIEPQMDTNGSKQKLGKQKEEIIKSKTVFSPRRQERKGWSIGIFAINVNQCG
jgi:hypothetical protein